jgi:hypothetical protein
LTTPAALICLVTLAIQTSEATDAGAPRRHHDVVTHSPPRLSRACPSNLRRPQSVRSPRVQNIALITTRSDRLEW